MSRRMLNMSVAVVLTAGAVAAAGTASAMPFADALAVRKAAEIDVVMVWGRGFGWGFGAGFLGGAIAGGALAAPYYGPYYYGAPYPYYAPPYPAPYGGNAATYCASRYKSYDPATGTFMGYDGLRHPCP